MDNKDTTQLRLVVDEDGNKHYLDKQIGQGGQGAVWRTADPNILVKMKINSVTGEPIVDEAEYEKYKRNLDEVRILDIPFKLHVAKPASILAKPYCGYTMRMLNDMKPIKYWIRPYDGETDPAAFYRNTGGLRHRLELLTGMAEIFANLRYHSAVYSDLSPENVFVSENLNSKEVWLIDADNMRYRFDVNRSVYTPGYEAPEIENGHVNTVFSDEYSFAVLAHEILTMNSPFDGEMLQETGDGWDDEEDEDSDAFIPWIEDPEDDSNRCYTGIPGRIVFSPGVRSLFERTFSREGQEKPETRPSMREWYNELRHAQDLTIKCKRCGSTFIMGSHDAQCPFCNEEHRNPVYYCRIIDSFNLDALVERENQSINEFNEEGDFSIANISTSDINNNKTIGMRMIDTFNGVYYLYNYHTDDLPFSFPIDPSIEIRIEWDKVTLTNLSQNNMRIHSRNTNYGILYPGSSKRLDSLDGLFVSIPVTYGKQYLDPNTEIIDDISLLRTRHIQFIKL